MAEEKKHMDVMYASSLRELIDKVNCYNKNFEIPISKDDVVQIFKDADTGLFYLVFYCK